MEIEVKLSSEEVNAALLKYLKENKERVKFIMIGRKPIIPEKFVPNVLRGEFLRGDYGEPFNYAINNGSCILSYQSLESSDYKFSCSIQVEFVEKKKDSTGTSSSGEKEAKKKKSSKPTDDSKYDVVCVKIKDNTINLINKLR